MKSMKYKTSRKEGKMKLYLEVNLQDLEEVKQADLKNKKENYIYTFIFDSNLINTECLLYLLRQDYEVLKHSSYGNIALRKVDIKWEIIAEN